MARVKDICEFIDTIAPYDTKCEWDNCGLLVGCGEKEIKKIGFALDLTPETLFHAVDIGAELIVTHHPVIFTAQKSFLEGNMAFEAAAKGISVISAHTCFDCADGGVNDVLCDLLDIRDAKGIESSECAVPMARIGNIDETDSDSFARKVSGALGTTSRVIGYKGSVKKVAVCGGAGMDFYLDAVKMGADAYVTGDISHHQMLLAQQTGVPVIAAGHFETENPAMSVLKKAVSDKFDDCETILLTQTNPVRFI